MYVGVYDEGVMVTNTGSRFDFFDPEVEKAVTMIGETGNGDESTQSIGHKGGRPEIDSRNWRILRDLNRL